MLNLMYITNRPEIAQIAESAGVDRIFVDILVKLIDRVVWIQSNQSILWMM